MTTRKNLIQTVINRIEPYRIATNLITDTNNETHSRNTMDQPRKSALAGSSLTLRLSYVLIHKTDMNRIRVLHVTIETTNQIIKMTKGGNTRLAQMTTMISAHSSKTKDVTTIQRTIALMILMVIGLAIVNKVALDETIRITRTDEKAQEI